MNNNNQKIRIVHTIPMGAGGISNLTLTINELIDRNHFQFDYLVFRNQKEFCDNRAKRLGSRKLIVDVTKEKNKIIKGIKKVVGTKKLLSNEKVEIIHIDASTPYDVILAIAAKWAGVKMIIFHAHNDNYERVFNLRNAMQPIFKFLIKYFVTDYIAISEAAAEFLFPKKVLKEKKYYLLKNGIDINKYTFNPQTRNLYREKYNFTNKFVVGHIGRFVYQKNHEFLIDIFNELQKRNPNAVLLLIGIGELYEQIKDKVNKLGIKDKVIFWGTTEDVPNLMQAMDCFVFPSRFEGLGMVAVEAQAAGLPTICSDAIPKEAEVSDCIVKLSLNRSAVSWAEEITRFTYITKRHNTGNEIRACGYDIIDTVKNLENIYKSNVK